MTAHGKNKASGGGDAEGQPDAQSDKGLAALRAHYWARIILTVAALVLFNAALFLLSQRVSLSLDLTANAIYRVGDETRLILSGLGRDVDISVLSTREGFEGSPYLKQVLRVLEEYPLYSARVRLFFVDVVSDPSFAARYPNLTLEANNILVASGGNTKQIRMPELFNMTPSADGSRMSIRSSRAEEALTSAIVSVTGEDRTEAVFLTGNAELSSPALASLLRDNNFSLTDHNLILGEVPPACSLAILIAPQNDLDAAALKTLDAFLYNGGVYGKTLLCAFDASQPPTPNLNAFLREWGVDVGEGAVFETSSERTYQYQPFYPVADYVSETYRDMLRDAGSLCIFPRARPLAALFASRDSVVVDTLARFAESAAVRPADAPENFTSKDAALRGPMPAMLLASRQIVENGVVVAQSHIVVSSSAAMFGDFALQSATLGNSEYLLKLLNRLTDRESAVHIPPKSLSRGRMAVPTATANLLAVVFIVIVPAGLLLAGITIRLIRRYQ